MMMNKQEQGLCKKKQIKSSLHDFNAAATGQYINF
jgi:hypothetical protein